ARAGQSGDAETAGRQARAPGRPQEEVEASVSRFAIEPGTDGARVDQAVARAVPGLSVAAARRLLAAGAVRLDGRPARKGDRVRAGQTLDVDDAQGAAEGPEGRRVTPDPAT